MAQAVAVPDLEEMPVESNLAILPNRRADLKGNPPQSSFGSPRAAPLELVGLELLPALGVNGDDFLHRMAMQTRGSFLAEVFEVCLKVESGCSEVHPTEAGDWNPRKLSRTAVGLIPDLIHFKGALTQQDRVLVSHPH